MNTLRNMSLAELIQTAYDSQMEFRWVTIGANKSAPDGEKGGTPVKIGPGGEIHAGPKNLVGRDLDNMKKPPAPNRVARQNSQDTIAARRKAAQGIQAIQKDLQSSPQGYPELQVEKIKDLINNLLFQTSWVVMRNGFFPG